MLLFEQLHQIFKRLVLVLLNLVLVIKANKKDVVVFDWVYYICYSIWLKKNKVQVQVLFDSSSKVNGMILGYTLKLGLKAYFTNVGAQKIMNFTL